MKTYYKGNLKLINRFLSDNYFIGHISGYTFYGSSTWSQFVDFCITKKNFDLSFLRKYSENQYIYAPSIFYENFDILKMPDFKIRYPSSSLMLPIIYEKIISEDGYEYGKEIHSNLIFPIGKKVSPIYQLMLESNAFSLGVNLRVTYEFKFPALDKCECIIHDDGVANQNEVDAYLNEFTGIFKKTKKEKYINKLLSYYKRNVFNTEIKKSEPKQVLLLEQSTENKLMEDIEITLQKIKKFDENNYQKYLLEYEKLLNSNNLSAVSLSVTSLGALLGKMEASLFLAKRGSDDIVKYLEELKVEYLNNFLTDNKITTKISLDDLDKINELFLKMKKEYDLVKQRKIIKDISFIYLLEVKENINNIDINRLKSSYFSSNIKSIVLAINSLYELDLIKKDLIINLNNDFRVENVLEIIKRMEFNYFDNLKLKELLKIKV